MAATAQLAAAVDALAAIDADDLDDAALGALVVEVNRQRDRLEAVLTRAITVQDRRVSWREDGAHSHKQWLAERCGMSMGQAAATTGRAKRLAGLPETTTALADGRIGWGHARVAADAARDLPDAARPGLDRLVADQAPSIDPAALRERADGYSHQAAPESLAEREQRAHRRRRLDATRAADGGVRINGLLDVEGGEALLAALAPLAAPDGPRDERSPEQRRADALAALSRRQLDSGALPESGGVRPHVTVTVSLEALRGQPDAAPAMLDRAGAVSADTARMLACDAGVSRIITAGASQPLDAGRQTRTVTPAQRRALGVRDGGCVGCRAPVGWCEAHHIRHWAHGGPTDLANLVLLCHRCHRTVHHDGWEVRRQADGTYTLHRPSRLTRSSPRSRPPNAPAVPAPTPAGPAAARAPAGAAAPTSARSDVTDSPAPGPYGSGSPSRAKRTRSPRQHPLPIESAEERPRYEVGKVTGDPASRGRHWRGLARLSPPRSASRR